MRSRSSALSRLIFARLTKVSYETCFSIPWPTVPVLKPDLDLPGAQSGDFSRQALPMGSVRVRLLRKLTHQKPCLLVSEPDNRQYL